MNQDFAKKDQLMEFSSILNPPEEGNILNLSTLGVNLSEAVISYPK